MGVHRLSSQHKIWRNFKQALKSIWTEDEINHWVERLSRLRDELQIHVIAGLRCVFSLSVSMIQAQYDSTGPVWIQ